MARPEPSQLGALVPVSECDTQVGGDTAPGWGGRPTGPSESRPPPRPCPRRGRLQPERARACPRAPRLDSGVHWCVRARGAWMCVSGVSVCTGVHMSRSV